MSVFHFKKFSIHQGRSALKVGTDAMLLGAITEVKQHSNCLDIGSGTGVLSLMLAQRNSSMRIDAVEIDTLSCKDCRENFNNSRWKELLTLHEIDFLDFNTKTKFDLIVSNPPFYLNSLLGDDDRTNSAKHNFSMPFPALFDKVSKLLQKDGSFWMICPFNHQKELLQLASTCDLFVNRLIWIHPKPKKSPNRVIMEFCKSKNEFVESSFVLRNEFNAYSVEYIELTKNFHNRQLT